MIRNVICNMLWVVSCLPGWIAFRLGLLAPERVQRRLLKRLLRRNRNTEWGRYHDFDALRTVRAFQQRHPLTSYEDYRKEIEQIASGQSHVLSESEVCLFEPTSGSTGPVKLVPYTDELKKDFQRGLSPWIVDLYMRYPRLFAGRAYWSVSPIGQEAACTRGGIPIRFDDDTDYLGRLGKYFMNRLFVVPPEVKDIRDMAAFRYITLLFLLAARDLTLISVWNPTFLALLLEPLKDDWISLCRDIATGTIKRDLPLDDGLRQQLQQRLQADPRRAREIEELFTMHHHLNFPYERLWPDLTLISCWTDAQAALSLPDLRKRFPNIPIQPKGLLATEGIVSFPLCGKEGAIPAFRSHFFEFMSIDEKDNRSYLLHELRKGERYSVVITTSGGFYRYQMNDVVEVIGMSGRLPLLKFVGRQNRISDLVGEKLSEAYLSEAVPSVFDALSIKPLFWMIAPERRGNVFGYILFVEPQTDPSIGEKALDALAEEVDRSLNNTFHYRYARQLGQLGPIRVIVVNHGQERYLEGCIAFGQRPGDVKPACLDLRIGWARYFKTVCKERNGALTVMEQQ